MNIAKYPYQITQGDEVIDPSTGISYAVMGVEWVHKALQYRIRCLGNHKFYCPRIKKLSVIPGKTSCVN